jgi:hypothetical protein
LAFPRRSNIGVLISGVALLSFALTTSRSISSWTKGLLQFHNTTGSVSYWALISPFTIEYKPGCTNIVADALSRRDTPDAQLHAISLPSFDLLDGIKLAVEIDAKLEDLHNRITVGTLGEPWSVVDGIVLYQKHIYIHAHFCLLQAILSVVHNDSHEGIQRTLHKLNQDFHVPSTRKIVQDFVCTCVVCQKNKTELW